MNQREYEAIDAIKENPRYFYTYAKSFRKSHTNIGPLKEGEAPLEHRPTQMANILQRLYGSVFSDPENANIDLVLELLRKRPAPLETIDTIEFSECDIIQAIDEIDRHAATSHEAIPAVILKECKEFIAIPLKILWD